MNKLMKTIMVLLLSVTLIACSNKAKEEPKASAALTFKEKSVEVLQDEKINSKDFVKSSKGKVVYPKLDTSKVGKQTLKYIVTGEDGKKKTFKLTVEVKAKTEEKEDASTNTEAPEKQENSSTTEPTPPVANNSGNNVTAPAPQPKPTPSNPQPVPPKPIPPAPQPPKPNVCVPDGTYKGLGNSGMLFNSDEEAMAWGESQIFDKNSPWYMMAFSTHPIWDSCGELTNKRTVDFY